MGIEQRMGAFGAVVVVGLLEILSGGCAPNRTPSERPVETQAVAIAQQTQKAGKGEVQYQKEFKRQEWEELAKHGVGKDIAQQYDDRFGSVEWIIQAHDAGLGPAEANQYPPKQFDHQYYVMDAFKAGVTGELARQYSKRFGAESIIALHKAGVTPQQANAYGTQFNTDDITKFVAANVPAVAANEYGERFMRRGWYGGSDRIVHAFQIGLTAGRAMRYDEQLELHEVIELHKVGISPKRFTAYDKQFIEDRWKNYDCEQVLALHQAGVEPEEANRFAALNRTFGSRIDGFDIIAFRQQGISYETVAQRTKEAMLIERIRN